MDHCSFEGNAGESLPMSNDQSSMSNIIPLPFQLRHFTRSLDLLVEFVVAEHFVLGDGIVHDVVDRAAREGEDAVKRMLKEDVLGPLRVVTRESRG
jgi:hypothetical protein